MEMNKKVAAVIAGIGITSTLATCMVVDYFNHSERELTSKATSMVKEELGKDAVFENVIYKTKDEFDKDSDIDSNVESMVVGNANDHLFWVWYGEDAEILSRAILDKDDFDYDNDGILDYEEDYTITSE